MNDFQKGILLIRHPLDAIMSTFNDLVSGDKKAYGSMEAYQKAHFSQQVFSYYFPWWQKFHDSIIQVVMSWIPKSSVRCLPKQIFGVCNAFTHQIGLNHNYKVQQYLPENPNNPPTYPDRV